MKSIPSNVQSNSAPLLSSTININNIITEDGDPCNDGDSSTHGDEYNGGVCAGTYMPVCKSTKYSIGDVMSWNGNNI